jgi:hypothetical protein
MILPPIEESIPGRPPGGCREGLRNYLIGQDAKPVPSVINLACSICNEKK